MADGGFDVAIAIDVHNVVVGYWGNVSFGGFGTKIFGVPRDDTGNCLRKEISRPKLRTFVGNIDQIKVDNKWFDKTKGVASVDSNNF